MINRKRYKCLILIMLILSIIIFSSGCAYYLDYNTSVSYQIYYAIFDALVLVIIFILLYCILHYLFKFKIAKVILNIFFTVLFILLVVIGVNYAFDYNNNPSLYELVPEINSFSDIAESFEKIYTNTILKGFDAYQITLTIVLVVMLILFLSSVKKNNKKHCTVIDRELLINKNKNKSNKKTNQFKNHQPKAYNREVPEFKKSVSEGTQQQKSAKVQQIEIDNPGEGLRAFTKASNYEKNTDGENNKVNKKNENEKNVFNRVNLIKVMKEALDEHDIGHFENLVKKGADLNQQDEEGRSCLHFLCEDAGLIGGEHFYMIKLMVENGVDINIQDNKGNTPLHYFNHTRGVIPEIIKYLKEKRADFNIRNDEGLTPAEQAHSMNNRELRDLFKDD